MAKKKKAAARKAVARKVEKKRTIRQFKAAKKTKAAKPRRAAGPRSQALPGMEDVRYKDLDRLCESIAETREEINRYKGEEADLENKALASMRAHERTTYTWSGVMLVRVPGEEKLIVRNSRQRTATATAVVDEAGEAADVVPPEEADEAGDSGTVN